MASIASDESSAIPNLFDTGDEETNAIENRQQHDEIINDEQADQAENRQNDEPAGDTQIADDENVTKRSRKPTEKGLQYQRTFWFDSRRAIYKRMVRRGEEVNSMTMVRSKTGIEESLARFNDTVAQFEDVHERYRAVISPEALEEDESWYDRADHFVFETRHQAISALRDIMDEADARSQRSVSHRLQNTGRHRHRTSGSTSSSNSSQTSSRSSSKQSSNSSSRSGKSAIRDRMLEEQLKLAELLAESQFVDEKHKIEVLRHREEVARTKARMNVLQQVEKEEADDSLEKQLPLDSTFTKEQSPSPARGHYIETCAPSNTELISHHPDMTEQSSPIDPAATTKVHGISTIESNHDLLVQLVKHQTAPEVDIETFDGDPLKFDYFIAVFKELVEAKIDDPKGRLLRLIKYTSGEARDAIRHCVQLPAKTCYKTALQLLRRRFGDQHLILATYRNELRNWPPVKFNEAKSFRKFLNFILKCQSFVCDSWNILDTPDTLCMLASKLPPALVDRWNRKVLMYRQKQFIEPKLSEFLLFIEDETKLINDPLYSREAVKQVVGSKQDKTSDRRGGKNLKTLVTKDETPKTSPPLAETKCRVCQGSHDLEDCFKLQSKDVNERSQLIGQLKLCYGCLEPITQGHTARNCPNRKICKVCDLKHPTCLHGFKFKSKSKSPSNQQTSQLRSNAKEFVPNQPDSKKVTATNTSQGTIDATNDDLTCLKTSHGQVISMCVVPVRVFNQATNREVNTMAMLDSCSQATFASDSLVERLGIKGRKTSLSIKTISGTEKLSSSVVTGLSICSTSDKDSTTILQKVYTRDELPVDPEEIATKDKLKRWPYLQPILDHVGEKDDVAVELLIGADCLKAIEPLEVIPSQQDGPYAYRTVLGWCVVGPINVQESSKTIGCNRISVGKNGNSRFEVDSLVKENDTEEMLKRLYNWDFIENEGSPFVGMEASVMSTNERRFMEIMEQGCSMDDGHYVLPLPFRKGDPDMPNNRYVAERRLQHLKQKFLKDPKFFSDYKAFMKKLIDRGHAVKCNTPPPKNKTWYLPHHGVYHPQKPEKIRVVLDCGAEYKGRSLNQELLCGPDMTNQLVGVLTRFRLEKIGIMADVEAMYYQVLIPPSQRSYTRFMWWEDGNIDGTPEDYEMTVHIFGGVSSANCANYALRRTAYDNIEEFICDVVEALLTSFYVDDMCESKEDVLDAIRFIKEVKQLCQRGGFNLTKFVTNNNEVSMSIPEEDKASSIKEATIMDGKLDAEDRALGVMWNLQDDTFVFKFEIKAKPSTRRGMLSSISSIYDPLGFVSPFVLEARTLLQRLCARKYDWDEPLPDDIAEAWSCWKSRMSQMSNISIPRCFKPPTFGDVADCSLHHFSDASEEGYGQCSYIRTVDTDGNIACSLVMGKSRVCPLKFVSMPRMELTAAVLSVRIASLIDKEIPWQNLKHHFWTDSKVVLSYIQNESRRFKTFVANRVQQIKSATSIEDWSYVKSEDNPADIASRGLNPNEDGKVDMWYNGPKFLMQPETSWNQGSIDATLDTNDNELKKVNVICKTDTCGFVQLVQNVSSWNKMKRIMARVVQAVNIMKKNRTSSQHLEVEEIIHAERILVKFVQQSNFGTELMSLKANKAVSSRSSICQLSPFLDNDGVIRVGGRLQQSDLSREAAHPVLLPKNHPLSKSIIRWCHEKIGHGGRGSTLNEIRSCGYWIINGNSNVKSVIFKCVTCRFLRGRVGQQVMGSLPKDRTIDAPPFTYCGVDFFGPFIVRDRRKELKRYGAIFTCFGCRAVHLEVATSLETDTFILALRRFIARRGNVRTIHSDNGTNFVGADNELRRAVQEMDHDKIQLFLSQHGADWNWEFNPPAASHMGGVWERQIRSIRRILTSLLKTHGLSLDDESLTTLMVETEAIVNSRPLTVEAINDVDSPSPLSPMNLLTMKSKVVLPPPGSFSDVGVYTRKRWRRVQHIANEFWSRWKTEYLQQLQSKQRWSKQRRNFMVGDIVILKDTTLVGVRNVWPIAKIVRTFPGDDGLVRCVDLYVGRTRSTVRRPITKIVLLVENEDV